MSFNPFKFVIGALSAVIGGQRKNVSVTTLILDLIMYLPGTIAQIKAQLYTDKKLDVKKVIDEALIQFDKKTGKGGIKILKGNIGGVEQTLDLFKELTRNLCYMTFNIEIPKKDIVVKYDD